jgi:hypothetical protein
MALHLSRKRMYGEQGIDALEIRAGGKQHGVSAARRGRAAGGNQHGKEQNQASGRRHGGILSR